MKSTLTQYGYVTIAVQRELRDRLSKRLKQLNADNNNPATKRYTMTSLISELLLDSHNIIGDRQIETASS